MTTTLMTPSLMMLPRKVTQEMLRTLMETAKRKLASNKLRPRRLQLKRKMATTQMGMTLDRQQMEKERWSLPPQLKSIRESEEKEVDSSNERGQLSGRLTQASSWEATAQITPMRRNEN